MEREPKNIDEILARYFNSQATDEENEILKNWLNQSKASHRTYLKLKTYTQQPRVNITDNRLKIWNQINKGNQVNRTKKYWQLAGKIAASFLFIIIIYAISNLFEENSAEQIVVAETIEKSTNAGQKLLVTLPDGSTVKLNSESIIQYPSSFNDSIRHVTLVGEAFFEVEKDSLKPFIINTKNIKTQVIGTSFNISAYPDENNVQIALLTGKVKVQKQNENEYFLDPGQIINISEESYKVELFNYQKVFGWKEGIIIFDGASFAEVIDQLEKWYGVSFIINQPTPDWNYHGVFSNATLKEVLQVLADSEGFEFEINSEEVSINL